MTAVVNLQVSILILISRVDDNITCQILPVKQQIIMSVFNFLSRSVLSSWMIATAPLLGM